MMDISNYKYDLFLSWTGTDRPLKNYIKQFFMTKYGDDFKIYDSDEDCNGLFRENYAEALYKSKVYLIILTDSLRNTDHITEVTRECDLACDREANRDLNIVTLCLSQFFTSPESRKPSDTLGWYFYTALCGHSMINGEYEGDTLSKNTFAKLDKDVTDFIAKRNAGCPAIPQRARFNVYSSSLPMDKKFKGREEQIDDIFNAFKDGARMVVLSGMGGIGKTKLAEAFARKAEEKNFFRCLQIVHVRELTQERNGLKILVSEVTYENTFYQDIARLNQAEQYNSKLNALKELPEYVLLVLDNFNSANSFAIKEIVDSLKCRILVTTRATIQDKELDSQVKSFAVPELPTEIAYDIFRETSGRTISLEDFTDLYVNIIKKHTITLCIIAKILYSHPDLLLEDLLSNMTDFSNLSQTVEFEHNSSFGGTNEENTILGHLQNLFNLTDLNDECKSILGNMSLLSDGRISCADIRKILNLTTDNSINTLVRNGWLEQYSGDDNQRYLYLHPIISQLAFSIIKPTQVTASGMVQYLCNLYDDMYNNLVYADAHIMEDKLFYCIYRLAITDKKLNIELWQRFSELSHLLGELDNLEKKKDILTKLIDDTNDKKRVISHYDMIRLEQHPTEFGLIEKYINNLQYNSEDYKWVLRSLSIALAHISNHPNYKELLNSTIEKAICVAEERRDDLGVFNLASFYWLTDPKAASANLKKYIRLRKSEGVNDGFILFLKIIVYSMGVNKDLNIFIEQGLDAIDDIYKEPSSRFKEFLSNLRHPVNVVRMASIFKQCLDLPDSDPLKFYFDAFLGLLASIEDNGEIDVQSLFEAAVELYRMNYENGMTLAPMQKTVSIIIEMIKRFPPEMQGDLKKLASIYYIDQNNITIGEMSQLGVACLINIKFGDKRALEQSRLILETEKKWHATNNNAIVQSLIRHGNNCLIFNIENEALKVFYEAYHILKENAPDSEQLAELCRSMLNLRIMSTSKNISELKEIRDTALSIYKIIGPQCGILDAYANRILDILVQMRSEGSIIDLSGCENHVHSFILNGLAEYVSKIVNDCLKESNDNDGISLINEALKQKVYPLFRITITSEIYNSLQGNKLSDYLSELVVKEYREIILKKYEIVQREVYYLFDECSNYKKAIETTLDDMRMGKVHITDFIQFKDRITTTLLSQLLEEIKMLNLNIRASRYIVKDRIQRQICEYDSIEQKLYKIWSSIEELNNAMNSIFNLANNITSFEEKWHNSILVILSSQYVAIKNANIDLVYSQKFAECFLILSKNATSEVAQKAQAYYFLVQGIINQDKGEDEKACGYFSKTIDKFLKYNTNYNDWLGYASDNYIRIAKKNACRQGGVPEFIKTLFGKSKRISKKISVMMMDLISSIYNDVTPNENGVPQGEATLLYEITVRIYNLRIEKRIMSNSDLFKLCKAKTLRPQRYLAYIITKALNEIKNPK